MSDEPIYSMHMVGTCILCGNDYVLINNEAMCYQCGKVNP